jgi:hypothetical protein
MPALARHRPRSGLLGVVENLGSPKPGPSDPTGDYVAEFNPEANADFTLTWKQPEVGFT